MSFIPVGPYSLYQIFKIYPVDTYVLISGLQKQQFDNLMPQLRQGLSCVGVSYLLGPVFAEAWSMNPNVWSP